MQVSRSLLLHLQNLHGLVLQDLAFHVRLQITYILLMKIIRKSFSKAASEYLWVDLVHRSYFLKLF